MEVDGAYIVAGLGGVVVLVAVIGAVLAWRYRRRQKRQGAPGCYDNVPMGFGMPAVDSPQSARALPSSLKGDRGGRGVFVSKAVSFSLRWREDSVYDKTTEGGGEGEDTERDVLQCTDTITIASDEKEESQEQEAHDASITTDGFSDSSVPGRRPPPFRLIDEDWSIPVRSSWEDAFSEGGIAFATAADYKLAASRIPSTSQPVSLVTGFDTYCQGTVHELVTCYTRGNAVTSRWWYITPIQGKVPLAT